MSPAVAGTGMGRTVWVKSPLAILADGAGGGVIRAWIDDRRTRALGWSAHISIDESSAFKVDAPIAVKRPRDG